MYFPMISKWIILLDNLLDNSDFNKTIIAFLLWSYYYGFVLAFNVKMLCHLILKI